MTAPRINGFGRRTYQQVAPVIRIPGADLNRFGRVVFPRSVPGNGDGQQIRVRLFDGQRVEQIVDFRVVLLPINLHNYTGISSTVGVYPPGR